MANDRSIFNYQAQADVYFVSMSIYKDLSLSTAMMMSKRTNDRGVRFLLQEQTIKALVRNVKRIVSPTQDRN